MTVQRTNTLHFNRRKSSGLDFTFIDGIIRQALYVSGTDLNVYKYDGVYDQFKDVTNGSNIDQVFSGSPSIANHRGVEKAFDDNEETYYETATIPTNVSEEFIKIDMGSASKNKIVINGIGLNGFGTGSLPKIIEFYGSDDDIIWDILAVLTTTNSDDLQRFEVVNDIPYRFFKLVAADETHAVSTWKVESIELYSEAGATGIQDKLFIENRDRKYNTAPLSLLTWYEIPEKLHDLGIFGFGIPSDQIELTLLISDTKAVLGRALMTGDIVTLPHIGDHSNDESNDLYGGIDDHVDGKMYEVVDVQISADGYDRYWRDHLYRVIAAPAKHRQETYDITGTPADGYIDLFAPHPLVTQNSDLAINNEVSREAKNAGKLGMDTTDIAGESSDTFTQDGIPNDGSPYTIGTEFPMAPVIDQYFLHEGYNPAKLYQWDGYRWIQREIGLRQVLGAGNTERGRLKQMLTGDNSESLNKK